jgi:hypothetical protein
MGKGRAFDSAASKNPTVPDPDDDGDDGEYYNNSKWK